MAAEISEAAEQTAWTKQTMSDLLAAAEADAEKVREQGDVEAAALRDEARARAESSDAEVEQRRRTAEELITAQRAEVQEEFAAVLESAQLDAGEIRQQAGDDAEQIISAAERQAADALERAAVARPRPRAPHVPCARRPSPTSSGCRTRLASCAGRPRTRPAGSSPRPGAEADDLRSAARSLLAEARAEVAVLTAHRDEITKQLADLSGVINALAVADRLDAAGAQDPVEHDASEPADPSSDTSDR